ncbi:hypothetical protein TWF788_001747 [Orbilia oligospora]|uniref:Uncharacterized protein n=1 Tax=Orbilia oligospora TaxID=2813651 RepID=A0A6G1M5D2_ORBOL|nr:hypothetical protein TWF788_001747 [Orbilia oligospora]KAF3200618.1 hypothetical protein TWF191_003701 [Orbilia oligospora]KAF3246368.1 hypothetical protein TWF192_006882 [Orbilia oligospora]
MSLDDGLSSIYILRRIQMEGLSMVIVGLYTWAGFDGLENRRNSQSRTDSDTKAFTFDCFVIAPGDVVSDYVGRLQRGPRTTVGRVWIINEVTNA